MVNRREQQRKAVLIAGPTASGKSAMALQLAKERHGLIINTDALQVYRDLAILTARPTDDEMLAGPHVLYGHISATSVYSVAHWLRDAKLALDVARQNDLLPIFTGGTGLYFKGLTEGLAEVPPIPADVRERWRNFDGDLHQELMRRDRGAALRLNPADKQRLARALEVIEGTGHSLQHWQEKATGRALLKDYDLERYLIEVPREALYARAEARFDVMMAEGAMDEVRPLLKFDSELPMMKAIGVPELTSHLRGEISLGQAVADAKTATRNYIKRQFTWWRGQQKHWIINRG